MGLLRIMMQKEYSIMERVPLPRKESLKLMMSFARKLKDRLLIV